MAICIRAQKDNGWRFFMAQEAGAPERLRDEGHMMGIYKGSGHLLIQEVLATPSW